MAFSDWIKKYLHRAYLHFVLLVFFFCLNGYRHFSTIVDPLAGMPFIAIVLTASGMVFYLLSALLRDRQKAGLLTFYLLFIFLFFGNLEDAFASVPWLVFLSEPAGFIPFLLLFSAMLVYALMRSKRLQRFHIFLNLLLIVLTGYELILAGVGGVNRLPTSQFLLPLKPIASDQKIPVYMVVLDEYACDSVLQHDFNFDNRLFKERMIKMGFADIRRTTSNYPLTVYSVASFLNMDYLPDEVLQKDVAYGYKYALSAIRNNRLAAVFSDWGYNIRNYSFFDFRTAPAYFSNSVWGGGIRPVTARCMHVRLYKHYVAFADKNHFGWFPDFERDHNYRHITEVLDLTRKQVPDIAKPAFHYLHFMTPHQPFLFDSTGGKLEMHTAEARSKDFNKKAYTWSVRQINRMMMDWSRDIIEKHKGRVVILILSDHGPISPGKEERSLDNLQMVFNPQKNYAAWYEGISNVNIGRLLLNQVYGQTLPLLKDTVYRIKGEGAEE